MSNNSKTNVRKVEKICFQAIWEFNFKISLKYLVVYIEKIKVRDPPCRQNLKYQIEVDSNPCWLVPASFLYDNLYWNK